ncbi:hypothetical protein AB4037_34005 [Labrys sp. KB_33_2]|uniref:hypothetical protein n=1 Tax=Labrys sp. KB_33_2 TaxID=3237479 RepID=UPI003F8EF693
MARPQRLNSAEDLGAQCIQGANPPFKADNTIDSSDVSKIRFALRITLPGQQPKTIQAETFNQTDHRLRG